MNVFVRRANVELMDECADFYQRDANKTERNFEIGARYTGTSYRKV